MRAEGLRGLARGLVATLAREVPGNALFFASYEVRTPTTGSASVSGPHAGALFVFECERVAPQDCRLPLRWWVCIAERHASVLSTVHGLVQAANRVTVPAAKRLCGGGIGSATSANPMAPPDASGHVQCPEEQSTQFGIAAVPVVDTASSGHACVPTQHSSSSAWHDRLGGFLGTVLAGGLAGCAMWGTVLPVDVAKTRIQVATKGDADDAGVLRMLRRMWREGGRHTLWAGLRPTLLRAFPANAAQWIVWELAVSALHPL